MVIAESNHQRLMVFSNEGKMMNVIVQATHHAEEIIPKAANALGI